MELPKKKIIRSKIIDPKQIVIYGPPKIGKTELISHLDNWLIIDTEGGSDNIDGLIVQINSFQELMDLGSSIIKEGRPYDGIIIDTVTELESWCEWDATEMYMASTQGKNFNRVKGTTNKLLPRDKWESVLSLANGAGYLWLRLSFKKWMKKINKLADHIILIAHIKDKFLTDNVLNANVNPQELDLTGRIKNIVCKDADVGYIYRNPKNRLELHISFKEYDSSYSAGSRSKHLRNQDITIAINNPDGSIKEHYWDKIFINMYNKK